MLLNHFCENYTYSSILLLIITFKYETGQLLSVHKGIYELIKRWNKTSNTPFNIPRACDTSLIPSQFTLKFSIIHTSWRNLNTGDLKYKISDCIYIAYNPMTLTKDNLNNHRSVPYSLWILPPELELFYLIAWPTSKN